VPYRRLDRTTRILLTAAAAWAALLVMAALVLPAYHSSTTATIGVTRIGASSARVILAPPRTASATLVGVNGLGILATLILPLLIVGLATMAMRAGQVVVAWSMTAFVLMAAVVGALSVGVLLLPIAVLLGVACGRVTSARRDQARPDNLWRPPQPSGEAG
jgi:hypothetical protein